LDTNFSNRRTAADFASLKTFTTKENKPIMRSVKCKNRPYAIFSTFLLLHAPWSKCSPWLSVVEHPHIKRMAFSLKCESTLFIFLFLVYFALCLQEFRALTDIHALIMHAFKSL
jgi:hypothetical protein